MEWSNKDYALHYHREINLMPIPVSGKQSLVAWKEYQDKVAPEHIVRDWFLKHINAGIAILTGPVSNVLVLDLDGQQAIDLISTKYPVPKTWMVQTRKGRHLYFKWDKRINFPTVIVKLCGMGSKKGETPEWGVDVRGHGGYVVAPPSEGVYHWLPGYAPWEVNLAPLPDWLFSLLTFHNKSEQEGSTTQPEKTWLTELLEGVGQGERHGALAKLSGYYFSRMPADVAEKLLADWNEKNTPPIPEPEFKAQVSDFARRYKSGEYKSKYTESSAPIDLEEDDIPLLPVNVNHFLDASSPEINWLVQNVIPYETSTIIGGMQGIGKSWALLDLAVEAAKGGGKWFNYLPVNKAKVLYIDEESHENLLRFRLKKIVGGKGIQGQHLDLDFAVGQGFSFTNPKKLSQFKELLRQLKPELIIMDSLIMFHGLDENLAKDMRYLFKIVKRIVDEYKVTFVFADHEGKGNPKDKGFQASHRLRGSSAKGDAADTVLSMSKRDMHLYVEHTKARYFKALPKFVVGINDLSPQATVVECLGLGGDS